jgi:enoyl-CoA hydratase/carnithine racemase
MEYQAIRLTLDRPLASIALARSSDANRIGARALRELEDACQRVRDDDGVRVVTLEAEGADFCTGWDDQVLAADFESTPDPFACVAALPQPTVCAIHGLASSAGLELTLACDIRICSNDARFSLPETAHGMLPRAGGTQRLARAAGRGVALAMLLAGEELDAAAAYRSGLVARVVERGRLGAEARAIAESVAARGPIATKYAKEAIHRGQDMTLDQALRYETDLTIILQTTEDRAEGVRAFVEKRSKFQFKGK